MNQGNAVAGGHHKGGAKPAEIAIGDLDSWFKQNQNLAQCGLNKWIENVFPGKCLFLERYLVWECFHLNMRKTISVSLTSKLNFLTSSDHGLEFMYVGSGGREQRKGDGFWGVWGRENQDFYNADFYSLIPYSKCDLEKSEMPLEWKGVTQ